MSVVVISRSFGFSIGTLLSDAQRLLGALKDDTIGSPVLVHVSPTFVADFEDQIALVTKLSADQSGAIGTVGTLVLSQAEALADYVRLAVVARRAARLAFPGQATLLRADFQVGARGSQDIPRSLERGRKLLAACQRYALELAHHGWSLTSSEMLENAVDTLTRLNRDRLDEGDGKLGLTAERIVAANRLFRQCLTVQNVARLIYDGARAAADPSTVATRARFLLGDFPRQSVSPIAVPPVPAAGADALVAAGAE